MAKKVKLAIVAYPVFEDADLVAIQAVRTRHDPQSSTLAPHFTLVFPIEAPMADVIEAANSVVPHMRSFSVRLRAVRAVRDPSSTRGHVFLVPDQGTTEVAGLHARLYGGALKWAKRNDIPYLPHVTIAACADFGECETLAATLAARRWDIRGAIDALTVVELVGAQVEVVASVPLAG